jgi:trk system potassium uptake protein TrkA
MLILHGDGADEDLLLEENVGEMDLFLSLTSDDEDNIMSAMLAKRLGARRVMALINRRAYADMMQGSTIDIAISPAQTVIGELLAHVRRGDVAAVHSLRRGAAEALEGVARGDVKTSRLVGRRVQEIKLPEGARIGVIVRGEGRQGEVLMPHHDTLIETDDHIVIFIPHKRMVREVEKLFQVSATFFG